MFSQVVMTVKGLVLLYGAARVFMFLLKPEEAAWLKGRPLAIVLSLFAIAMLGQSVWVAYLALLLVLPIAARDRAEGAALYAVAMTAIPDVSSNVNIGSIYLMPFDKYLFLALGMAIVFKMKPPTGDRIGRHYDLSFGLLLFLALAQISFTNFTSTLRVLASPALTLVLPYYVLSRSLTKPEHVRRFALAFVFIGFVMAVIAFVEAHTGWLIYKQVSQGLHMRASRINQYLKIRAGMLRAPASFGESTALGLYLAMTMIGLLALRRSFGATWKWGAAMGVVVLGLLAANSRNAWVGIGIGVVAFDIYRRRFGSLAMKLGALGALYGVLVLLAPFSPYIAALVGHSSDTQSTADYRMELLQRGIEEIRKHPYLGTSIKNAMDNLQDLQQGEGIVDLVNGYIFYGLTVGVGGVIALFTIFAGMCVAMLIARKRLAVDKATEALGGFVLAVSAFYIVTSFYTGFGGTASTPYLEIVALGSAIFSLRQVAVAQAPARLPDTIAEDEMASEDYVPNLARRPRPARATTRRPPAPRVRPARS